MTLKQSCQTIGLDLKRVAHILLINGSESKKEYFLSEAKEILEEISGQNLPEKIKKILYFFSFAEILQKSTRYQTDAFLTWGSIISLRAASL